MSGANESKPASYSTTDEQETLAIDTFKNLVDHKRVRMDIKERDKYPNIDGHLELVDENRSPIGKLEVQIKKLPSQGSKLQCPFSLFSYSEVTCNPVLLVGVDIDQKRAYWIHLTKDLIAGTPVSNGQKTLVISFPSENVVSADNDLYVEEWKEIIRKYQCKMTEYSQLENLYNELLKRANAALGDECVEFSEIHVFLDEVNSLLDEKFRMVKQIFYPNAWKIGLAYYEYGNNSVTYTLYPISLRRNDVQIKKVDDALRKQLREEGLGFTGHHVENPIKSRPFEYAVEVVEHDTLRVLEHKLLKLESEFLAKEFLCSFIDKFALEMGLDKKDKYALSDVARAFFQFLPIWVDEAIKFMVKVRRNGVSSPYDLLYGKPYFDPGMLVHQIMKEEREQILEAVIERVKQGDHSAGLYLGNDKFSFRAFVESLHFLRVKGYGEVERPYLQKDYSRLKNGGWIWNVFSPEVLEKNLKIFFENLPKAYADLVSHNFPELSKELPLFNGSSLFIVVFDIKETYAALKDSPTIELFGLRNGSDDCLQIELYKKGSGEVPFGLSFESFGKDLDIKGKKYRLVYARSSILDFIYEDVPMIGFVYDELENKLKQYFNSLRNIS